MRGKALKGNNPLFPLPADYAALSVDGQRQARVWAVGLCDTPENYVLSWAFTRNYYLSDLPPHISFYKTGLAASPDFHWEGVYDSMAYDRNWYAAPRGFGKSVVFGTELPIKDTIGNAGTSIGVVMSIKKLLTGRFSSISKQLKFNEKIINDFGMLVPKKGMGTFNMEQMELTNGSELSGYCVEGAKRGGRHHKLYVDDPEKDIQTVTGNEAARDWLYTTVFKVLIPMLPPDGKLFWICTMVSSRSFAYSIYTVSEVEDEDLFRQVEDWNKVKLAARWDEFDDAGEVTRKFLWPDIWGAEPLAKREKELGPSAFAAEYLNEPIAVGDRILSIDNEMHTYTVGGEVETSPFAGRALVRFKRLPATVKMSVTVTKEDIERDAEWVEEPAAEFFGRMFRAMTVDYAPTVNKRSDYSCVHILGFDHRNWLWSLDMWLGKVRDAELLRIIYKLGAKWGVKVVGVENYSVQQQLLDSVQSFVFDRAESGWLPRVVPIRYPRHVSKADRIAALEWRFNRYAIRLPIHRRNSWPYSELWSQLESFTYDMALMNKDDAADTLAMSQQVAHTRGSKAGHILTPDELLKERMRKGQLFDELGFPIFSGMSSQDIPVDEIDKMLHAEYNRAKKRQKGPIRHAFRDTQVISRRY